MGILGKSKQGTAFPYSNLQEESMRIIKALFAKISTCIPWEIQIRRKKKPNLRNGDTILEL